MGSPFWSAPHLTFQYLEPLASGFTVNWQAFVGVILALSGVEAIANLTGVMKLDQGATLAKPSVAETARWAIWPVAIEVVLGTSLLGWAMLSMPHSMASALHDRQSDMVRFLAEHYGTLTLGPTLGSLFGAVTGAVIGLLLLSAVNTALSALILGATHRRTLVGILKGSVVTEVARHLPENIQLLIHG